MIVDLTARRRERRRKALAAEEVAGGVFVANGLILGEETARELVEAPLEVRTRIARALLHDRILTTEPRP